MSSFCCIFRFLGDLGGAVAFPILISRILSSKAGCEGVSLTTQVFHLIIYFARYADTYIPGLAPPTYVSSKSTPLTWGEWLLQWYTPAAKAYFMVLSVWVLLAMAYRTISDCSRAAKENRQPFKGKGCTKLFKALALYIIPAFCVGYVFNYRYPFQYMWSREFQKRPLWYIPSPLDIWKVQSYEWTEVFWSFSILLATFADIPQYQKYYAYLSGRISHDWWLMSYCIATVSFRQFYLVHWVHRFLSQNSVDPLAFSCGFIQTVIFWIFVAFCRNKLRANARSSLLNDEEVKVGTGEKEIIFDSDE